MPEKSDPTVTSDTAQRGESATSPQASSNEARFAPGSILAGRYRIVSLLGRGGMGEVYRADDLKLSQPVALKFLPEAIATDPRRLTRFLNEVRLARQVTHPAVCRVHDVGELDGQHFISMEYVDGEDLASLLRRAGRLSLERGVELARQICLGLAAAHDRGVLHRDLKPANIMVDGRGRARLTDFGLAIAAEDVAAERDIAGTPAYMAPEQLSGSRVSARSDVYALGLVLYEMFSGKPAFRAPTLAELVRLQQQADPVAPSTHAPDLDPALERLILRCLAKDAAQRPASAIAVAAALPGADPLGALVAAGETPPPELVAAAGSQGTVSPARAWGAFAFVAIGLPIGLALMEPLTVLRGVPLDKPPEVLAERAREIAREALAAPSADEAWGFEFDRHAPEPSRRVRFWYRGAPRELRAFSSYGNVSPEDPGLAPGMVRVRLDTEGRLLEMVAAAEDADAGPKDGAGPDWTALLGATGLDVTALEPAAPGRVPPVFADSRVAWTGPPPIGRLEAAALGDRPVWISRLPPAPARRDGSSAPGVAFAVLWAVVMALAGLLAARNVRLGRGDRVGAWRLAVWAVCVRVAFWILATSHMRNLVWEKALLQHGLARAFYLGVLLWVLYLAIEPAIRRRWPDSLVSWSRLLQGRFRDPMVGRDILAGLAGAVALGLVWAGARSLSPGAPLLPVDPDFLLGTRPFLAWMLLNQIDAVFGCLFLLVMAVVARALVRDLRLAAVGAVVVLAGLTSVTLGVGGPAEIVAGVVVSLLLVEVLMRFGVLAVAALTFLLGTGDTTIPATLQLTSWHGEAALAWLVIAVGLAGWAAYVATGGKLVPAVSLLDD